MIVQLAATPDAPAEARAAVIASLDGDARVAAASLATSEVVTNALLHGDLDRREPIELRLDDDGVRVRVEVLNAPLTGFDVADVADSRRAEVGAAGAAGGWGLGIVGAVSSSWGVEDEDGRALVWFEIV